MSKESKFEKHIIKYVSDDRKTVSAIGRIIADLGLPLPYDGADYVKGADGLILFSSRFGVVLRIEADTPSRDINRNPWVLQPLGTYRAGKARIEVCPGVETTNDPEDLTTVTCALPSTGFQMNDPHEGNIGLLPVRSPNFPNGIPVVIDRPAVSLLTRRIKNVKVALRQMGLAEDPQTKLYAPLRQALKEAWPNSTKRPDHLKMKKFWMLCQKSVKEGTLIAGWDHLDHCPNDGVEKQYAAADSAQNYDQKIARLFKIGNRGP